MIVENKERTKMKTIKTNKTTTETLQDRFAIGDSLKYTNNWYNGRGESGTETLYFKVVKVNKVTIDVIDEEGDTIRLNREDISNCKKIIQKEILA
jgi:flagellar hook assembly protein FlgD